MSDDLDDLAADVEMAASDLDDLAADVEMAASDLGLLASRLTEHVAELATEGVEVAGWLLGQQRAAEVRGAADADVWGQVADAFDDACARRKPGATLDGQRVELRLGGS